MKKILTTIVLSATVAGASAQMAVDAKPQGTQTFAAGQKLSTEGFVPATAQGFIANDLTASVGADVPSVGRITKYVPHKSAAVHYSYSAGGTDYKEQSAQTWTMLAGHMEDGTAALQDVIPDCFDAGGIGVPYSLTGNTLTIEPTYLGSTSKAYVFIFGRKEDADGYNVLMTLNGKGAISVAPEQNIIYGAFASRVFDMDEYLGYYEIVSGVSYKKDVVVGDANEDRTVDKDDTQTLVNHLLNRSQDNADADAMDTNADGSINVADVMGLSNIIKNNK